MSWSAISRAAGNRSDWNRPSFSCGWRSAALEEVARLAADEVQAQVFRLPLLEELDRRADDVRVEAAGQALVRGHDHEKDLVLPPHLHSGWRSGSARVATSFRTSIIFRA
jgi:hypothetical protein